MKYRIWYSTESFADFIIANTNLKNKIYTKKKMYESDANNSKNFHTMPDHIKKILYLDAPDLIIEIDHEPIFSVEVSTEAGTGHNVFQRFARLAASVENNVPSFYIYPEAVIITRQNTAPRWDKINPLVFKALDDVMSIYKIPSLFYYFPTDYPHDAVTSPNLLKKGVKYDQNRNYAGSPLATDSEMQLMFSAMNEIIGVVENQGVIRGRENLLNKRLIIDRRTFMNQEFIVKGGTMNTSPLSATLKIPTQYLLNYLRKHENTHYQIGELLKSRNETIIYKVDAKFRGDPYPGALAAIDYLLCREGKSFEERKYNLVMVWGNLTIDNVNNTLNIISTKSTINDFISSVQASENKNILSKEYRLSDNFCGTVKKS
ncbi:MAG: hypothetical protein COZ18_02260 [Flexibacter sp. CG_4_10_14_3_um_filter_32_15]|nr:MAG: hypothetical protein COZ18_02260 [Flexibacter sp. CG_4_10_14_3_um_filter_32_15]